MINNAFAAANKYINTPTMPFPECGAMSQGYIGYHLQNALKTELNNRQLNKEIATIITQVVVDEMILDLLIQLNLLDLFILRRKH